MKLLYDIFFIIFSLAYVPYLLLKGKWHRGFFQKMGFLPKRTETSERPVWIHAVSVGEAIVAVKLARRIKNIRRDIPIVISTTTPTGNSIVRGTGADSADMVFYYPMDISFVVRKVVRFINPRLYIMVETELWPNMLEELSARKIPVVMVNGRLSDASFRNYRMIGPIVKRILSKVDRFSMQTPSDASRIGMLGALRQNVFVSGNMKFEEKVQGIGSLSISRDRVFIDKGDTVVIAGSTHHPEEKIVLGIYAKLKKKKENVKLILAPRHIGRKKKVSGYIREQGLTYRYLSDILNRGETAGPGCDVLIVDTIGHLKDLYALGDIIFVGGSIAKRGGQNPIEPAVWGKAIIFGPHMYNFKEVSRIFLEKGAAVRVRNAKELENAVNDLLNNEDKRKDMSENAREAVLDNQGAAERTMDLVTGYL
ncbi:MAG: 3-deoxy-D-manno-octulosonic acid transferase [Candidatus Omnitrophota bacterium]|nr:3-deoxy-D-manno-octulosonic acid transferase [Candidatus Omnitrophota bacterium]